MNKLVYQYSIVRFMPFPETEEFANIGIVLVFPKLNIMLFKLESLRKTKRVVEFFDLSNRKQLYKSAIEALRNELEFFKEKVECNDFQAESIILSLARPKQTVLQYSTVRTGIAKSSPAELLEELFVKYVDFNTQVRELNEYKLERSIRSYLDNLNLDKPFKKQEIGSKDLYKVTFPFVREGEAGLDVIKPLFLGQKEASKVFEHGDLLISKLRRLRYLGLMPNRLLIPYQVGVEDQDLIIRENQNRVISELKEFAEVVSSSDQEALDIFAY